MTRTIAACGTDGGYYRHRRITNTEPCEACKRAHADWKRQRANTPFGRCPCGTALRTENEYCSRCRRKLERAEAKQQQDEEGDPKRPVAWVRRGAILRPVYEQSAADRRAA
jgi:hypothetical protein